MTDQSLKYKPIRTLFASVRDDYQLLHPECGAKIVLCSNHLETIIKYFVTNLNKHKHSIRSGYLVY